MSEITHSSYVAPTFSLRIVEVESPICAGSVNIPQTTHTLSINKQDFATSEEFSADFSNETTGWTPNDQ